jgi:Bacterial surface proteins containing Ig-like domains
MNKLFRRIIASVICAAILAPGFALPASAARPYAGRSVSPMTAPSNLSWSRIGTEIYANWATISGVSSYTVTVYKSGVLVGTNASAAGGTCDITSYISGNGQGSYTFKVSPNDGSGSISSINNAFAYVNSLSIDSSSIIGTSSVYTKYTTPVIWGYLADSTFSGDTVMLYEGNAIVGTGSVTASSFSITTNALSAGSHTIYAVLTNGAAVVGISNTLTFVVDTTAFSISTTTLPDASTSAYYSQQLLPTSTATSATLTWSMISGALPTGLSLSAGGLISGYPTTIGSYTFTVQATSMGGQTAQKALTISVYTTTANATRLPNGNTGTAYSYTLTFGIAASWSVATGSKLPAGLSLSSAGVIGGTPTTAGTYTFCITLNVSSSAVGATPLSITQTYTMTVTSIPIITTLTLNDGNVGTGYSQSLVASNAPTSWSIISGGLPTGLSINIKTGAITGTPTAVGSYTFSIVAKNNTDNSDIMQYTINILGIPSIVTTSLPNANVGSYYSYQVNSINAPTAWGIISGSIPTGMTLGFSTGVISGYPAAAGVYTFVITATNTAGASNAQQLTIVVINGTAAPANITITGTGTATNASATIQAADTKPAVANTVTVKLFGATVASPASILNAAVGANDANWLQMTLNGSSTVSGDAAAAEKTLGLTAVSTMELDLTRYNADGSKDVLQQLGGSVAVTVYLTDAQIAQLKTMYSPCLMYYDASTKTLTDMKASFNLGGKTATFKTDSFGPFIIAAKTLTKTLGVTYRSNIGGKGWQGYLSNGKTSGITGKNFLLTALSVKLTGNPSGISVSYQTYLHGRGWQKAATNGVTSGLSSSGLYLEGLRVTITGIAGYSVTYRVYQQGKGWQSWKSTNGGTAVAAAAVAGSPGKNIRISAVQIKVNKITA